MSRKEKEKPLLEKVRTFFSKLSKGQRAIGSSARSAPEVQRLTKDILETLDPKHPFTERAQAMRELVEILRASRIEDGGLEALWKRVSDLLNENSPAGMDGKIAAWEFLCKIMEVHVKSMNDPMREMAFRAIDQTYSKECAEYSLAFLNILTEEGRKYHNIEERVGPFLLKVFPDVIVSDRAVKFLNILEMVIKFNTAYLDPPLITSYIQYLCSFCQCTGMEKEIEASLNILDAIISYSYLPTEALLPFTQTLCRLANYPDYCPRAWKSMRNLLGTCLGHSAIYAMTNMLMHFEDNTMDEFLLRGAIFFISMSLWGSQRVNALKHTPLSVLPSISKVLDCDHTLIAYEVSLTLVRLVEKHGKHQTRPAWDLIFEIVAKLIAFSDKKPNPEINTQLQKLLTAMENVLLEVKLSDEAMKLYDLIDKCSYSRPEESVLRLLNFWAERIHPLRSQWIEHLQMIMTNYYKKETRLRVRLETLRILKNVLESNRAVFEEELVDKIVLPFLGNIEMEKNVVVREQATEILIEVAGNLQSKKFLKIIDILERIIKQPFSGKLNEAMEDPDLADVKVALGGLTQIFRMKLYQLPSDHCIRVYQILVSHLMSHYRKPICAEKAEVWRYMVFECFLSLRADSRYHLGICDSRNNVEFSPYIMVDHRRGEHHSQVAPPTSQSSSSSTSPPPASPSAASSTIGATASSVFSTPYPSCKISLLSLTQACGALIAGLQKEKDWTVLQLLLTALPEVLGNKALTLSRNGNDMHYLVDAACNLMNEKSRMPEQLSSLDFQGFVFPVLIALVPYHRHVDPERQTKLITAIKRGLMTKSTASCIDALTMSALEMTETMHKIIPSTLQELSRMTATKNIALPTLLFLSTLIRLPGVYKSFIEDQYRSIFAIALQYTNPVKFEHSVISLAHHVIAMWFLKCRLPLRRQLVQFITTGLEDHALKTTAAKAAAKNTPTDESRGARTMGDDLAADPGAFGRQRSSSLHERANPFKKESLHGGGSSCSTSEENLLSFHQELAMTCLDLMARYSFAHVSPLTNRTHISDFLLQNGVSESWIMGNEIITVTTSACSLRPLRPGTFCDTCWTRCAGNASLSGETIQTQPSVVPSAISAPIDIESPKRKRHQSEFTGGSPSQASSNFWSAAAKDDLHMWNSEDNVASSHAEGSSTKRPGNELHDDGRILCTCWCQGWAEIHIRRPTGSTSWAMKIQNSAIRSSSLCNDRVLGDIMSHLLPSLRERAVDTDLDSVIQSVEEKDVNVSVGSVKSDLLDADPVNSSRDSVTHSSAAVENALSKSQTNLVSVSKLLSDGHTGSMPDSLYTACSNKSAEASPVRKSAPGSPEMQHEDSAGLLVPTSSRVLQHRNSLQTTMLGVKPLGIPSSETAFRERSRTVSHAGQVGRPRGSVLLSRTGSTNTLGSGSKDPGERAGINPKFVFLQLFYGGHLRASGDVDKNDESEPLLLPRTREVERSIKNLDRIYPYETHKIGIIYIGRNQLDAGRDSEKEILSNDFGSPRYMEFIQGLGEIISLSDIDTRTTFLGGLDTGGLDGEFAVTWRDELMQVIFHIATLMPKSESDPNCNNKKKHIGNDFVLIVYNESGRPYNTSIVKGQVIYSWIEIQPLPHGCNKILVHARPESDVCLFAGGRPAPIISDRNLALYVRQVALHADLLSCFYMEAKGKLPYSSKWLERLRQIRRLRSKLNEDKRSGSSSGKEGGSPNKTVDPHASSTIGSLSPQQRRPIVTSSFNHFFVVRVVLVASEMSSTGKLVFCALGVFVCYFFYGILMERITRGDYDGEKFTYSMSLVWALCVANCVFSKLTLSTLSPEGPDTTRTMYYSVCSLTYLLAMISSTMALQWVNYPTQVVGKSCKPIPVMILGVLLGNKKYSLQKYCFVFLIVAGVCMFMWKDSAKTIKGPENTSMGEVLLVLSLLMDGCTAAVQERMKSEHKTKPLTMMYYMNLGGIIYLTFSLLLTGELVLFIMFVMEHTHLIWDIMIFSVASALGQFFIFLTVSEFGPLPLSLITTTRKFFTVLASVVIFGHHIAPRQWFGAVLVFTGLIMDGVYSKGSGKAKPSSS
ncbi:unnamed protein product [Notodromas monacha]|uniref:Rap-GAP domain-containing protein n=1 Tax=Notodromas monacha TaxID=399045 RepID=A0A7R9GAQ4_9CRUS|nr:unnamed protein product [Notodromas monacha]CAG0914003.1 unnamed protein product [Notodromas monacha]